MTGKGREVADLMERRGVSILCVQETRWKIMDMAVSGRRKKGRPKRRWMDLVREDMERVGTRQEDKVDRVKWRLLSRCGDPE